MLNIKKHVCTRNLRVDETDRFASAPIALIARYRGNESDPKSPPPGRLDPIPHHPYVRKRPSISNWAIQATGPRSQLLASTRYHIAASRDSLAGTTNDHWSTGIMISGASFRIKSVRGRPMSEELGRLLSKKCPKLGCVRKLSEHYIMWFISNIWQTLYITSIMF